MGVTGKVIIFGAPSGSGKSTLISHLTHASDQFGFSISATTRKPRGNEVNGVDYHFLSEQEFQEAINNDKFVEYEEVYSGLKYGTLKSEIEQLWSNGKIILFDVDVKGAVSLKKYFGEKALSIFIKVPSLEILEQRLRARQTDSEESIQKRKARWKEELTYESEFDFTLLNENLQKSVIILKDKVSNFTDISFN